MPSINNTSNKNIFVYITAGEAMSLELTEPSAIQFDPALEKLIADGKNLSIDTLLQIEQLRTARAAQQNDLRRSEYDRNQKELVVKGADAVLIPQGLSINFDSEIYQMLKDNTQLQEYVKQGVLTFIDDKKIPEVVEKFGIKVASGLADDRGEVPVYDASGLTMDKKTKRVGGQINVDATVNKAQVVSAAKLAAGTESLSSLNESNEKANLFAK